METEQGIDLRTIPGTCGKYEIDIFGNVFRVWRAKKTLMKPTVKKGHQTIRLILSDGTRKEFRVHKLVQMVYLGPAPAGKVLHHKNGDRLDNCVNNLAFISRKELGQKTGYRSRRVPVVKKDTKGNYIELYRSARAAAKENFMSYQTIIDFCNGKIKRKTAIDGFVYCWDR